MKLEDAIKMIRLRHNEVVNALDSREATNGDELQWISGFSDGLEFALDVLKEVKQ